MDLASAGLREQPFRTHGHPISRITYGAQQTARLALSAVRNAPCGLMILQGPPLSGKSTLIRDYADSLDQDYPFAIVEGKGLNTTGLLESGLRQFGYSLDRSSANEMLGLLRVFCLQQTASHEAPLLIVENADLLNPSALHTLCELANVRLRQKCALKIVLVSDRSMQAIIDAPALQAIARRVSANFHLRPMTEQEVRHYLYLKLRTAGSDVPEFIFPREICTALWRASGGWPGILDRVALLALAKARTMPVALEDIEQPLLPTGTWDSDSLPDQYPAGSGPDTREVPEAPKLVVSLDGQTVEEREFSQSRLLVGRSDHNDMALNSRYVSRHHLLLVRHGSSTFLMDLNSTNGTYVNSRRVSNHVLINNDVVSIGSHRVKFIDPQATHRGKLDGAEFADTAVMKSLDDMRRLLAQENTAILPSATDENMPTLG